MRMRKKPNLEKRLADCAALIEVEPEKNAGVWKTKYAGYAGLHLEIGCGKGRFTAACAAENKDILLAAVEKERSAMVMAAERARDAGLGNIRFIDIDAAKLKEIFAAGEVDRIYINFCDPWPKSRDAKFRLTAPAFLRSYADVLPEGGEIHFKTDNLPLFTWSEEVMRQEGWELKEITNDLHANGTDGIIMTDYEAKFSAQGVKINRLVAVKTAGTKDTSAGEPPRLRDAALSDARNC